MLVNTAPDVVIFTTKKQKVEHQLTVHIATIWIHITLQSSLSSQNPTEQKNYFNYPEF